MLYLSKTSFVYRFYKILVIEPTTEVKAVSIGAPSVKEISREFLCMGMNYFRIAKFLAYFVEGAGDYLDHSIDFNSRKL
jgi:hypothetical protein